MLKQVEETFGNSIVMTVPTAAHTMFQIVLAKKSGPVMLVYWEP